jgi:hypothetical protein
LSTAITRLLKFTQRARFVFTSFSVPLKVRTVSMSPRLRRQSIFSQRKRDLLLRAQAGEERDLEVGPHEHAWCAFMSAG